MVSLVVLCPLLCAQLANDTHVTPAKAGRGTHWMYSSTAELVGSSGTLSCEANKKNGGRGGRCVDVVIIIAAAVVAVMAVMTVEVAARVAGSHAGTFPRAYLQRLVMHASNPFCCTTRSHPGAPYNTHLGKQLIGVLLVLRNMHGRLQVGERSSYARAHSGSQRCHTRLARAEDET